MKDPPAAPNDQGSLYLMHPAMEALFPPERRIALPTRYTMCGGPALVAAFDYLARSLRNQRRDPRIDDACERIESVGQRGGARLQDQRRLDLVQLIVAHGRNLIEAGPRDDFRRARISFRTRSRR